MTAMDSDAEKALPEVEHSSRGSLDVVVEEFSEAEQKKILRRIDVRLITASGVLYCASLIDRTNMSAANIAGMARDLRLQGNNYNVASLVFFVSYVVFQPPSTIICRKLGPRFHIAGITLLWGVAIVGMAFVQDFGALAALRFVVGILEAGFFPSVVYLLSTWYTRYEIGKRYALFYIVGCVSSGFSGILAFGLMQLGGKAGLAGWRWIFFLEGLLTIALGIIAYWWLVGFPDSKRPSWKFLGEREIAWVVRKVDADRGDSHTPKFEWKKFLSAGADIKIWAYALMFFATTTISYALAYFLPIILVENLKFDIGAAQCLVAPPYAFAGFFMFLMGWLGDRYHVRGPIVCINMIVALIGLPILGWATQPYVRYFGVFLVTAGANSNIPTVMSYQANNIRGQWKRAFCSATMVGFGGIGGIAGTLVFRSQDAATGYRPGLYACIAACLLIIALTCLCDLKFWLENKKADRGEKELETYDVSLYTAPTCSAEK
ncbi:hypothetical protein DL766_003258 [Monosporascus sp. MC13-8B]|uniref:Major facilitator superfamily (MFS) profile domain-containing protein n=1 Tax=Monosporascus cannonballus TaxID=155416 RepID=A0ABY0HBQ3_9PEZI|nr:hypothetical protein DL762_003221 [Monosporascus cannonballus]RYP00826.1 hypothetical protein DL763_000551 [Monosporascus cannonballus]RYP33817.1 hypothetical protein DL766_003258 [Monosporascus sp. MC13-8B]